MADSWLEPYIASILTDKSDILDQWRRQTPALSGGTKNFETWLLVELVGRLLQTGKIANLKTNGNLRNIKIKASEVNGLSGKKLEAKHLSPDLDILLHDDSTISSEIKTGLARKDLLNDLMIVNHYRKIGLSKQVEFVWVTLFPVEEEAYRKAVKSLDKTYRIMHDNNPDLSFICTKITSWMTLVVAVSA